MVRVQSAAGVSPSISVQSGKSALRRDLRQQASRFALMSAIGLAAAATGSLMTPGEALADCVLNLTTVVCNTTTTTNTAHPNGQPNDRAYTVIEALPLNASVSPAGAITGHGLALANLGDGGVSVTNDGTITVDAGNAPTEGGTAALTITANGGVLTYTGGAITNNGTGSGLDARQNGGNDTIDINLTGAVRGGYGVNARNNGSGGVSITAAAPVVGTVIDGIYAETRGGGGISIAAGDATGQTGSGITAQLLDTVTSTNAITITADNLVGRTGLFATNHGLGGVFIATTGDVTGTIGEGLFAAGGGDVDVVIGGVVTGGMQGLKVQAAGDISVQAAEINALNGNAVDIDNQGAGEVNFVATGPITASNGHGVHVRDNPAGGDITITTGAVSAEDETFNGIDIVSSSLTADVTVVANGAVRAGESGIEARLAAGSSGDIDLTANGPVNGRQGIVAVSSGSGSVAVTANAQVTAGSGAGVLARSSGGDVTVNVADVSSVSGIGVSADQSEATGAGDVSISAGAVSGSQGILASNLGTGATSITASGPVTGNGAGGIGIQAFGRNYISIGTSGLVTGATRGMVLLSSLGGVGDIFVNGSGGVTGLNGNAVEIDNNGAGSVTFQNSGPITATNGHGVIVRDTPIGRDISIFTGAVTANSATYDGILVVSNSTTANISVVANGDIQAGAYGIDLVTAFGSIGNINITANGSITGGGGISAAAQGDGSVNVTAVGPITATSEYGIIASAFSGGDVTIHAGDVTSDGSTGIEVGADGGDIDVTAGRVSGTYGVFAFNDGPGATVIRTNGAVTGTTQEGIEVSARGSVRVEVADTVTGATDGAQIEVAELSSGDISVTGAGGFVGLDGYGLSVENDGSGRIDIDISGAVVAGNGVGVYVNNDASDSGDINVATGDVTAVGADYEGILVSTRSLDAEVSITANGDIAADAVGVSAHVLADATGDIHVTTNGSVAAEIGIGAQNLGSGAITVNAIGPITATSSGIVARSQGGDISIAAGDVSATADFGVIALQQYAAGGGDIDITTTGAVSGVTAILAQNTGSGGVSVNASGPLTGTENGLVAISAGGDVTVTAGDVSAIDAYGVFAWQENPAGAGNVHVTTTGAISGRTGIHARNDGSGASTVVASGPITAVDVGISARSQGGDITIAAGDVSSSGAYGVFARQENAAGAGDIDIATTGAVSGFTGIEALNDGSGAVSVNASGSTTATVAAVVAISQGGDVTVAAGDLHSIASYGIYALQNNAAGAGNVDITTTGAVVGIVGVRAWNEGSGSVSVNANGPIATGGSGIVAVSQGGDVTVAAGDVSASGNYGVSALQETAAGVGDVAVATTGAVSGETAILAQNNGSGAVVVDASGPITAIDVGIIARTLGGDITIAAGPVTSGGDFAVFAEQANAAGAGEIDITTTGAISGALHGIVASNFGSGAIRIAAGGGGHRRRRHRNRRAG